MLYLLVLDQHPDVFPFPSPPCCGLGTKPPSLVDGPPDSIDFGGFFGKPGVNLKCHCVYSDVVAVIQCPSDLFPVVA